MKQLTNQQIINALNQLIVKIDTRNSELASIKSISAKTKKMLEDQSQDAASVIQKTIEYVSLFN